MQLESCYSACILLQMCEHSDLKLDLALAGGGPASPPGAERFAAFFAVRACATGKLKPGFPSSAESWGERALLHSNTLHVSSHDQCGSMTGYGADVHLVRIPGMLWNLRDNLQLSFELGSNFDEHYGIGI